VLWGCGKLSGMFLAGVGVCVCVCVCVFIFPWLIPERRRDGFPPPHPSLSPFHPSLDLSALARKGVSTLESISAIEKT